MGSMMITFKWLVQYHGYVRRSRARVMKGFVSRRLLLLLCCCLLPSQCVALGKRISLQRHVLFRDLSSELFSLQMHFLFRDISSDTFSLQMHFLFRDISS